MRIERIEIRNYRSFCYAAFENLPPMVVVVGANGTGKSTLFGLLNDPHTLPAARAKAQVESHAHDAYIGAGKAPYQV